MSLPREPDPVNRIASLFSPDRALLSLVRRRLVEAFGPEDLVSPPLFFDRTRYYEREMGWPLHRLFVSFGPLVSPESLVETKLSTNALEGEFLMGGKRRVNIDPGYVSPERLVLATGKNYIHRIYLDKGIYADLTLLYKRGGFEALPWTYRDYAAPETLAFFTHLRRLYMEKLKRSRLVPPGNTPEEEARSEGQGPGEGEAS